MGQRDRMDPQLGTIDPFASIFFSNVMSFYFSPVETPDLENSKVPPSAAEADSAAAFGSH